MFEKHFWRLGGMEHMDKVRYTFFNNISGALAGRSYYEILEIYRYLKKRLEITLPGHPTCHRNKLAIRGTLQTGSSGT